MRITFSLDGEIVKRAKEHLQAVGKTMNQEIREHLAHVAGDDKEEIKKWVEELQRTSGQGKPNLGWKWNRDEVYADRIKRPRK